MSNIEYRKATVEDCYSIAELKGIVWNTTYKGIYSDEKLIGYDVKKNEKMRTLQVYVISKERQK